MQIKSFLFKLTFYHSIYFHTYFISQVDKVNIFQMFKFLFISYNFYINANKFQIFAPPLSLSLVFSFLEFSFPLWNNERGQIH